MRLVATDKPSIAFEIGGKVVEKLDFFEDLRKEDGRTVLQLERLMAVPHGRLASLYSKTKKRPGIETILLALLVMGYEITLDKS